MKRIGVALAASVLLTSFAAACSGGSSGGSGGGSGGVLKIGTTLFPDSLNPFVGVDGDAATVWEYTYPHLDQYNTQTFQYEPNFARSWQTSANGLTWTFHTQPNWKWSDGKPLTAGDAAWSINTDIKFAKGAAAVNSGYVEDVSSAVAPSSTTLVLHLTSALAPSSILANLVQLPILPEHVWAKYATGNGAQLKTVTNIPTKGHPDVSGGPFEVTEFQPHNLVILGRNPYWNGTKPKIQGFGMQYFSDTSALIQALESGSIDFISNGVEPTVAATLKSKGFTVVPAASTVQVVLSINAYHDAAHPELANPLVREAFDYAIDRTTIAKTAYLGYARPIEDGLIVPGEGSAPGTTQPWANPAIKVTPFDIAKANQLLNQAGYKMGANGVRTADGHPMAYTVILEEPIGGPGFRLFSIMQADFQKIGVRLTVRPLDYSAAINAIYANKYSNWDMLYDFNGGPIDPNYMLNSFTCSQLYSLNNSGYCNQTFDKLYAEQNVASTAAKRVSLVWRMESLFTQARSYIGIVSQDQLNAWDKHFAGYVPGPNSYVFWTSMQTLLRLHQT